MTDIEKPQQLETQRNSIRNQLASIGDFPSVTYSRFTASAASPIAIAQIPAIVDMVPVG